MRICKYGECRHKAGGTCKMHSFPSDHFQCRRWMKLCKVAGTPRRLPAQIYICSCHFFGGEGPTKENPDPLPYDPPSSCQNPFQLKKFRTPLKLKEVTHHIEQPSVESKSEQGRIITDRDCRPQQGNQEKDDDLETVIFSRQSSIATPQNSPVVSNNSSSVTKETLRSFIRFAGTDSFETDFNRLTTPPVSFEKDTLKQSQKRSAGNRKFKVGKRFKAKDVTENDEQQGPFNLMIPTRSDFEMQCDFSLLSYDRSARLTEKEFIHLTGLRRTSFDILFEMVEEEGIENLKYYRSTAATPKHIRITTHSPKDKLFMTLVRLRRGFSVRDMQIFFGISEGAVSLIFTTWVRLLSIKFKSIEEAMFVSASAQELNKPDCYQPFPNLRCVVDSTDIKIQKPDDMQQQTNTWSDYKAHNIVKFLVTISLYGGLSHISRGFEGNMSDRQLFLKSGIMDHLAPGDAVMTDRGFDIEADLDELGVDHIAPPYLGDRQAFTAREALLAKAIASSRIHVETFIGRMKFFKILRGTLPNTMIDIVSDLVRVCANLVNFSDPFIDWDTNSVGEKVKERK